MSQSANDWASPDPTQNMSLADADKLRYAMAGALGVQFGDRYVKTTQGSIISEAELRSNQFISPLPVNLWARLAIPGSLEFNIATFRTNLRQAALADDPIGTLVGILQVLLPFDTQIDSMFTRMPAVQQLIANALRAF
jgi:hypothetical protein